MSVDQGSDIDQPVSSLETESQNQIAAERTEIVGYDDSTGYYALRKAGEICYVDASEMFERLNRNEVIYIDGTGSIPKMTLWYGEDDEVFLYEGSNVVIDKITLADFNLRLEEIFDTSWSRKEYETVKENIHKLIMDKLTREDQEKQLNSGSLDDTKSYSRTYAFVTIIKHDEDRGSVVAYTAKVKASPESDELTLSQALAIIEELELWKEAIRIEVTSLIDRRHVFHIVEKNDIPPGAKIYNLLILLKRKRNQFQEITKYKRRLVMDASRQVVGVDVFDTFAPVIDYSIVRLLEEKQIRAVEKETAKLEKTIAKEQKAIEKA